MLFIPRSAASFVITPLVPGFPSHDAKPHSPGETRQQEIPEIRNRKPEENSIRNPRFEIRNYLCQFVTVVLKCRKLSRKTRVQPLIPTPSLPPSPSKPVTVTPLEIRSAAFCFRRSRALPLPR